MLNVTSAQAGRIQTCYAVAHAVGQLVNGSIVDRVKPVWHMLAGVSVACACNLRMGAAATYPAIDLLILAAGAPRRTGFSHEGA